MSSLVQVRNVSDDVRRALKARAAAQGKSLNAFLLEMFEREMATPTVAEVLDRAERRAERASSSALDAIAAARGEREDRLSGRSR